MVKFSRAVLAGATLLFFAYLAGAQQPEPVRISFTIESQPLPDALYAWAQQAGLQIIWPEDSKAATLMAPRLSGSFTAESALQQLLMGSGLTYSFVDSRTVAISSSPAPAKPIAALQSEDQRTNIVQGSAEIQFGGPRARSSSGHARCAVRLRTSCS